MGFMFAGNDNYAHFGGLAAGFVLGKLFIDRPPQVNRKRALPTFLAGERDRRRRMLRPDAAVFLPVQDDLPHANLIVGRGFSQRHIDSYE